MALSFTCPNCGREHAGIKESMLGKKGKCKCGNTFRLGSKQSGNAEFEVVPVVSPPESAPADDYAIEVIHSPSLDAGSFELGEPGSYPEAVLDDYSYGKPSKQHFRQASFGPKTYSRFSIVRLLMGMCSGTLAILFTILCIYFFAELLDRRGALNRFNANFGRDANPSAGETVQTVSVWIFAIIGIILSVAYFLGGLAQFIFSWFQVVRQNQERGIADVFVISLSAIAIVAVLGTWIYLNVQISEGYGLQKRQFQISSQQMSMLSDERQIEIRDNLSSQQKMISDSIFEIRWALVKQLLIHVIIPGIVIGLSLYRVLKKKQTNSA